MRAADLTYNLDINTDRKSTRLNSSHDQISYAVFCLKKKKQNHRSPRSPGETEFYIRGRNWSAEKVYLLQSADGTYSELLPQECDRCPRRFLSPIFATLLCDTTN